MQLSVDSLDSSNVAGNDTQFAKPINMFRRESSALPPPTHFFSGGGGEGGDEEEEGGGRGGKSDGEGGCAAQYSQSVLLGLFSRDWRAEGGEGRGRRGGGEGVLFATDTNDWDSVALAKCDRIAPSNLRRESSDLVHPTCIPRLPTHHADDKDARGRDLSFVSFSFSSLYSDLPAHPVELADEDEECQITEVKGGG